MSYRIFFIPVLVGLLGMSFAFGQSGQSVSPDPILSVSGEVARTLKLSSADVAKLPRQAVSARDHDGKPTAFEGVALVDILRLAGMEFGEKLRGKNLALFLTVDATDGYRAVFALPELDPAFTDQTIILADRRDGKVLPEAEGQWRIVVPNETRPARWVRKVIALTIRRA